MFEKKEGPSEEERIKAGIIKASQGRRFEKQMKTMMTENSGANPLAMEMALRAKIGNSQVKLRSPDEEESFEATGAGVEAGEAEVRVQQGRSNEMRKKQ